MDEKKNHSGDLLHYFLLVLLFLQCSMASLLSSSTSLFSSSSACMICALPLKNKEKKNVRARTTWIKAVSSAEPDKEEKTAQTSTEPSASDDKPIRPKKPEYSSKLLTVLVNVLMFTLYGSLSWLWPVQLMTFFSCITPHLRC